MNDKSLIVGAIVLIIAVGAILYVASGNQQGSTVTGAPTTGTVSGTASGPNVALAQCLKDAGVVFYGAFWCPHCKAQKEDFGAAVPALPYVECSTPDGNSQTPICIQKGIQSYPTWVFPDGSRLTGEQSLATLAAKASCTQALTGVAATTTAGVSASSSAVK
jgi:thiol-disulfide isomerase/thioredoxin